ncbi:RNase P subunit p30 domain-containing protein [Sarocladium implicatum]|nr:RNase P subunit p30 domain-containing protein [Sarocladium implicatum]
MLYDLNIHWSPSTTQAQLLQTLTLASSLGYGTVALSHSLTLPVPSQFKKPLPDLASIGQTTLPHVLHRATLPLSDPSASNYRIPSLAPLYDILAVRPLTKDAFHNACLNLDVPIISLDFTQHFPFHFRPKPCMAAVNRGVRFEICYGQVLDPSIDARARANFISNVTSLVRATCGRGIILSSEAKNALLLRAPADVVNLMNVWGLSNDKGLEALRSTPRGVVVNEGIKRSGFRGVIDMVKVPDSDTGKGSVADKQAQNRKQNDDQGKNQKRKPGPDEPSPGQAISKRQAKKMKLASRTQADPPSGKTT